MNGCTVGDRETDTKHERCSLAIKHDLMTSWWCCSSRSVFSVKCLQSWDVLCWLVAEKFGQLWRKGEMPSCLRFRLGSVYRWCLARLIIHQTVSGLKCTGSDTKNEVNLEIVQSCFVVYLPFGINHLESVFLFFLKRVENWLPHQHIYMLFRANVTWGIRCF